MREKIQQYVNDYMKRPVGDDERLISDGLIDSLGALKLMLFLEKECGLKTSDPDFDVELLDSINEIVETIQDQQ